MLSQYLSLSIIMELYSWIVPQNALLWIPPTPALLGGHHVSTNTHKGKKLTSSPSHPFPCSWKEQLQAISWQNWNRPPCNFYPVFHTLVHFAKAMQKALSFCPHSLLTWQTQYRFFQFLALILEEGLPLPLPILDFRTQIGVSSSLLKAPVMNVNHIVRV